MHANDLLKGIQPNQTRSGIAGLLLRLLVLEERLRNPELHSEYFRWGVENHKAQLVILHRQYSNIRKEFNDITVEQFLVEIVAQKELLVQMNDMRPYVIRTIAMAGCRGVINRMQDMIRLKGIVNQLPDVAKLKLMPEVLIPLLDVPPGNDSL